jgi:predicted DNA-binding protein (MmcQ/YjbR family)
VNPLTIRPQRLSRLRRICLSFPEAAEKEAWGDPTWRIRDRIFAMQKGNYEGGRPSLWLKGAEGAQSVLVGSDPARYFIPPYVGHKGWVGIYLDGRVDWALLRDLVEESYRLIAPKRLASEPSTSRRRGRPK